MKRTRLLLVPALACALLVPGLTGADKAPAQAAERAGGILELGHVFYQLRAAEGGVAEVDFPVLFVPPEGSAWTWRANVQLWRDDNFIATLDTGSGTPGPNAGRQGAVFHYRNHTKGVYTVGPSTVTIDYTDGRPSETFTDDTRGHVYIKDSSSLRLSGSRPHPKSDRVQFVVRARNLGTGKPWPATIVNITMKTSRGDVRVARAITGFDGVARASANVPSRRNYQAFTRADATTYQAGSNEIAIPAAR